MWCNFVASCEFLSRTSRRVVYFFVPQARTWFCVSVCQCWCSRAPLCARVRGRVRCWYSLDICSARMHCVDGCEAVGASGGMDGELSAVTQAGTPLECGIYISPLRRYPRAVARFIMMLTEMTTVVVMMVLPMLVLRQCSSASCMPAAIVMQS